jgi:large subunit ribosomal protein L24
MTQNMRIRRGDIVTIVAGRDRPARGKTEKTGKVLRVIPESEMVVVEGVNSRVRHTKPNPQAGQQGGRVEREMPLHVSNVMFYCDQCKSGARLRISRQGKDKRRVRVCAKCGAEHA